MTCTTDLGNDNHAGPQRTCVATRRTLYALLLLLGLTGFSPGRASAVVTYVGPLGSCVCNVANCTTCTITTSRTVPINRSIILSCGTAVGVPSASDSGGAYTMDAHSTASGRAGTILSRLKIAAPLTSGSAITITVPSALSAGCVADEYAGIAAGGKDVVAINNNNNTTALSVGPSAASTQAKAASVAAFACATRSDRPLTLSDPSYSMTSMSGTSTLATNRTVWGAWKQLNATGAQTLAATLGAPGGNTDCSNVLVVYKAILPTTTCAGAAHPWQAINVALSNGLNGGVGDYTITTRVPNVPGLGCDLTTDTVITINLPAGTDALASSATFNGMPVTLLSNTGTTLTFESPIPLTFNEPVTIVLSNVTNPGVGTKTLSMSAAPTEDGVIGLTPSVSYMINAPCSSPWQAITVTTSPSNPTPGSKAAYTIATTVPNSTTCALTTASVITLTLPAGSSVVGVTGTLNGSAIIFTTLSGTTATFSSPVAVAHNAPVTIVLNDVTNPGVGPKTLDLSANPTQVGAIPVTTSASYSIVATPRLCYPEATGVPYTFVPPTMDGATFVSTFGASVEKDTGWTHAFRYTLSNGTPVTDGAVQALQDSSANHIYLSFEMKNDSTYDDDDAIVVAFNPDGTAANMRRIIIYPLTSPGGATSPTAVILTPIKYWHGRNATGWLNPQTNPAFITGLARSTASPNTWDVQVRIDRSAAGINLPASGDFGMYVNLVRVNTAVLPKTNTQFTWPPSTPLVTGANLEDDSLPASSVWGTASLATSCSGVHFSVSDISTNHAGFIHSTLANSFSVNLHNSGTLDATNVRATFQIANFGMPAPSQFVNPGSAFGNAMTGNPTVTTTVNGGGGTATLSTTSGPGPGTWTLNAAEQAAYAPPGDHQCIRVTLNSTTPGTVFGVQSSWNNFHIGTASEFAHDAVVGTQGYRLAPGQNQHQFDLSVRRQMTPACGDPAVIEKYPDLKHSELIYTVHGCRRTGTFLIIHGQKYENCESVGSFGYQVRHEGRVQEFKDELSGRGLERSGRGKDTYRLSVAPGENAVLRTRVVSVDVGEQKPRKRGLCGQFVKPSVGAMLFLGLLGLGVAVYRPKSRGE